LFGFKDCQLPEPGSSVICYAISPFNAWIIGSIPINDRDTTVYPSRTTTGQGDSIVDEANLQGYGTDFSKTVYNNVRRPTDVVQGEHVYSNDFGVLMGLFQQMATLKASELAQIQVHLLDDLVRIISHNFQHWTSSGELKIYHDGQSLLTEYSATHIPQESYGQPIRQDNTATHPFIETNKSTADDLNDYYSLSNNERAKAIERFKIYIGRLGDFINTFLAIPDNTVLPDLAGTVPTKPDLGAFNFHLGLDGGTHVRSIKEIFLEKVNWIRVPQRIREPEDPTGDLAEDIKLPIKEEFVFNNDYKANENPFLYYLQLRDYVAYTSQTNNYANLSQYQKDFYLNSDITKETPISDIGYVDPQTPAKNQGNFELRTSGMYLMDNGGVVLRDAWGSAIILEGGNIYIQPAQHLYLQPLGSLICKIGQFVSIAANNDIDLSSTTGGYRCKTNLAQYLYSDNSGIILHANGITPTSGIPDPTTEAIQTIGGVVLKSALGVYSFATTDILQYASSSLVLKSDDNIVVQSATDLLMTSATDCVIGAQSTLALVSQGSAELVAGSSLAMGGVTGTSIGQKGIFLDLGYLPITENPYVDPIKGALDINSLVTPFQQIFTTNALQYVDSFTTKAEFLNLQFRFLNSSKYQITNLDAPIPQTIAQQQDLFINSGDLSPWQETSVNSTYPYPGANLFDSIYAASSGLNNFQNYPSGNDIAEITNGVANPTQISNNSLQTYTILNIES